MSILILPPLLAFTLILTAHWLGDYYFQMQIPGMATSKGSNSYIALAHVCIYTTCHSILALVFPIPAVIVAMIPIGVLHFLQDRYHWPLKPIMKIISDLPEESKVWGPVLYVVVDNGYHLITNLLSIITVTILMV